MVCVKESIESPYGRGMKLRMNEVSAGSVLWNRIENPFRLKSEKELFERIDHSVAQADAGELQEAEEALDDVISELML